VKDSGDAAGSGVLAAGGGKAAPRASTAVGAAALFRPKTLTPEGSQHHRHRPAVVPGLDSQVALQHGQQHRRNCQLRSRHQHQRHLQTAKTRAASTRMQCSRHQRQGRLSNAPRCSPSVHERQCHLQTAETWAAATRLLALAVWLFPAVLSSALQRVSTACLNVVVRITGDLHTRTSRAGASQPSSIIGMTVLGLSSKAGGWGRNLAGRTSGFVNQVGLDCRQSLAGMHHMTVPSTQDCK